MIAAICGVLSLWLILRFLWRVYERGGPTHVRSAAAALRQVYDPGWLDKLTKFLPKGGRTGLTQPTPAAEDTSA